MKLKGILLLVALTAHLVVSGQNEKGTWFVNGVNFLSLQVGKMTATYESSDYESNFSTFTIGPSLISENLSLNSFPTINYGITDQLCGGVSVLVATMSMKEDDEKYSSTIMTIGPSVRYYISQEGKFNPFAEGKALFGSFRSAYDDDEDEKTSLSGWYLGLGGTYFIWPKAGFDIFLGYNRFTSKEKETSSNWEGKNNGIVLGVGILLGF